MRTSAQKMQRGIDMTIPRAQFVFRNKNRVILNPEPRVSFANEEREAELKKEFDEKKEKMRGIIGDDEEILAALGLMPQSYYDKITELRVANSKGKKGHGKGNKNNIRSRSEAL